MRSFQTSSMKLTTRTFFNHMSDEDFIAVAEAGQLLNLCNALSLDLNSSNQDETF